MRLGQAIAPEEVFSDLPRSIYLGVTDYIHAVRTSLPDIFASAKLKYREDIAYDILLVAGMRKLESLVVSPFWVLDNSLHNLERSEVATVSVGSQVYERGTGFHQELRELVSDYSKVVEELGLAELLEIRSYADLVRELRNRRKYAQESD